MRTLPLLLVAALALAPFVAPLASAGLVVQVSLFGGPFVLAGAPVIVSGNATVGQPLVGVPFAGQGIDVDEGATRVGLATTDAAGYYALTVSWPARGTHTLHAYALDANPTVRQESNPLPLTVAEAPTVLSASASVTGDGVATLSWTLDDGGARATVRIDRGVNGSAPFTVAHVPASPGAWSFATLPHASYHFTLSASNAVASDAGRELAYAWTVP